MNAPRPSAANLAGPHPTAPRSARQHVENRFPTSITCLLTKRW